MANEELISQYVDRAGIQEDTDFMLKRLNDIYGAFKKINSIKVKLEGDSSFKAAADSIKKLRTEEEELARVQAQVAAARQKLQIQMSQHAKELAAEKEAIRLRNAELKNQVREETAAEGSIEQLRATLIRLNKEYDNLSAAERNAGKGQGLKTQIQSIDAELKKLEGDTGRFQRNVGNYSGAVKTLEKALGEVRKKLDDFNQTGKGSADVVEALAKEERLLSQLVENQVNGFASATAELKNNEKALQALGAAGLQNTQFYQELLKQTAELKDNVGDLKAEIKNLSSDTKMLDGLVGSAQVLASSYGIAQGAAALFGDENEELEKTFIKLQAVQTILNGLQGIQNALQKESSVMLFLNTARTKALTAATMLKNYVLTGSVKAQQANIAVTNADTAAKAVNTTATKAATAASIAFRTALIATGIGAILILLSTAASAMSNFGDETEDATGDLETFNETLENSKAILDSYTGSLDYQNKLAIEKLKQRGASEREITDAIVEGVELKKQANEREIQNLTDKYNRISRKDKDYKEKSISVLDAIDKAKEKSLDYDREIELTRQQFRTKSIEDARKKAKENADESIKLSEREFKARFELMKYNREKEIEYLQSQAGEESYPMTARLQFLMKALEEEEELIAARRDFELANSKLTASERELIEQKAVDAIIAIRTQYAADVIKINQQVAESDKKSIQEAIEWTQKEVQKGIDRQVGDEQQRLENRLQGYKDFYNADVQIELERYTKGEISSEEYEKRKEKLGKDYQRKSLLAQIAYYTKLVEMVDLPEDAKKEALAKLREYEQQLLDDSVDANEEANRKKEAADKAFAEKKRDAYKQLGEELKGLVFDVFTGQIDREKQALEEDISLLEEKKNKDIEVANQTILNADKREQAIIAIEARANAERVQMERRKRQLEQERARFERARNIADIIQTTAIAVVGALKPDGFTPLPARIALAAVIGAIGAAQIARVIAQPLPKYKHGKGEYDNYEGLAVVGDGGRKEAIIRENGNVEVTPARDTLTWVGKNDIIHPDADKFFTKMQMQMANRKVGEMVAGYKGNSQTVDLSPLQGTLKNGFGQLNRSIKNMPQTHIQVQSIAKKWISSKGSYTDFI